MISNILNDDIYTGTLRIHKKKTVYIRGKAIKLPEEEHFIFEKVHFMSKYSNEFKLEVINYCINEYHGYADAEKHFGVNHELLRKWIKNIRNMEQ